jgi:hypothetical protein
MVGGLQLLHVSEPSTVGNCGNSVRTDPPVSAYPSNNTFSPEGRMFLLVLDVLPTRYHDAPVSALIVTDLPQEHNASPDTILVPLVLYILLL